MIGRSQLGPSDLVVSRLGLGSAPLGTLPSAAGQAVVGAAVEAGMTYVDTAPMYGTGRSESSVGAALGDLEDVVISTKAGRLLLSVPEAEADDGDDGGDDASYAAMRWDFTARGMRCSLEESLRRIGRDHIDLLYVHDPDNHEPEATAHALPELARMRDEGVLRAIGVGMNSGGMLARLADRFDLDAVLLAGRYTLLDQSGLRDVLPVCHRRGTAVVLGGVFNSGVLADPGRPAVTYDNRSASTFILDQARLVAGVAERYGVTGRALALQFAAAHPAVATVLVGAAAEAEVVDAVAAFTTLVPEAAWDDLRSAGLLDPAAPTPTEDTAP